LYLLRGLFLGYCTDKSEKAAECKLQEYWVNSALLNQAPALTAWGKGRNVK